METCVWFKNLSWDLKISFSLSWSEPLAFSVGYLHHSQFSWLNVCDLSGFQGHLQSLLYVTSLSLPTQKISANIWSRKIGEFLYVLHVGRDILNLLHRIINLIIDLDSVGSKEVMWFFHVTSTGICHSRCLPFPSLLRHNLPNHLKQYSNFHLHSSLHSCLSVFLPLRM